MEAKDRKKRVYKIILMMMIIGMITDHIFLLSLPFPSVNVSGIMVHGTYSKLVFLLNRLIFQCCVQLFLSTNCTHNKSCTSTPTTLEPSPYISFFSKTRKKTISIFLFLRMNALHSFPLTSSSYRIVWLCLRVRRLDWIACMFKYIQQHHIRIYEESKKKILCFYPFLVWLVQTSIFLEKDKWISFAPGKL